jgi:hypothetical protein
VAKAAFSSCLPIAFCLLLWPPPYSLLPRHVVLFLTRVYRQDLEKPVCKRSSCVCWLPPPPLRVSSWGLAWPGRGTCPTGVGEGQPAWGQGIPAVLTSWRAGRGPRLALAALVGRSHALWQGQKQRNFLG